MAVLEINEVAKGRTGAVRKDNSREYVRKWNCKTDDPNDDFADINLAWESLIGIYRADPHPNDAYSYALELTGECISVDGKKWLLTLPYGPDPLQERTLNPVLWPAKYSWSFSDNFTYYTSFNIYGNPIFTNGFMEELDIVEQEFTAAQLTISKNVYSFSSLLPMRYKGKVNSDWYLGCAPRCVLCDQVEIGEVVQDSTFGDYYNIKVHLKFNPNTWDYIRPNAGFEYEDGTNGRKPFLDAYGNPATTPHLLDSTNGALPLGSPPHVLRDEVKYKVPFSPVFYWT